MTDQEKVARVAIIGAGPAGIFAAQQLAENGIDVVLFNRDIKPGGLAEYGIYPNKTRIKDGLRCQFRGILHKPGIYYYGNTPIGETHPIKLTDLKKMGFAAVLVAAGAQGTKRLGIPGEESRGVYHAKELVYHYNQLPPYACQNFTIGKNVMVVGVGNVMTDVVRYLLTQPHVEEITTIARRGLAEVKFDDKELSPIVAALDWKDFQAEFKRITPVMEAVGQDPDEHMIMISDTYSAVTEKRKFPAWRLHFLYSPVEILSDADGTVRGISLEENTLELSPDGVKARGTGKVIQQSIDTLIFAIGDQVDRDLGLPVQGSKFILNEQPRFPVNGISFELQGNSTDGEDLNSVFVSGWSRNASAGMVGLARKDGMSAAKAIQAYLADKPVLAVIEISELEIKLKRAGYTFVKISDIARLEAAENEQAQAKQEPEFKFDSNEEMLKVMGLRS